jgi:phosphatidylserine/phosphatidylglycerophosphate/cardiolipin synthase-like enzyme
MIFDRLRYCLIFLLIICFSSSVYSANKKIDSYIGKAFFTLEKGNNIPEIIINLIKNEKKSIYIAMYQFSNRNIADALIKAKRSGVDVKVIINSKSCSETVRYLIKNNIQVLKCDGIEKEGKMHNKFALFSSNNDKNIVVTGSYNYTYNSDRNRENIVVLDNKDIFFKLNNTFSYLQRRSR